MGTDDWQDGRSLLECMDYMLRYEVTCDIHFRVGESQTDVGAHKFMMTSRSPAVQRLLEADTQNSKKKPLVITIPDVTLDTFRDVLTYGLY